MLGSITSTYATRQLGAAVLALALAAPLAYWGTSLASPAYHGPMVTGHARVVDGDTLEVAGVKVRMEGIDAPEADQTCPSPGGGTWRCGSVAGNELLRLIGGRPVTCDNRGTDKYGRMLGVCTVDGLNLNAEMVRRGLAWAFVRYSRSFVTEERDARARKVGIWQSAATPAWEHRARRWAQAEPSAPAGCAIKGNITSHGKIYHMPWSPWYDKVRIEPEKGERWFCSEDEAVKAGWRPVQMH